MKITVTTGIVKLMSPGGFGLKRAPGLTLFQ